MKACSVTLLCNLDDLRSLVQQLAERGVRVEFVKESLTFTGEDSPMANLMLSVMGIRRLSKFSASSLNGRIAHSLVSRNSENLFRGNQNIQVRAVAPTLKAKDFMIEFSAEDNRRN